MRWSRCNTKLCVQLQHVLFVRLINGEDVAPELIEKFRKGAEGVLKSKDAVSALAAALAVPLCPSQLTPMLVS